MIEIFLPITFMVSLLLISIGLSKLDLTKALTMKNIEEYNRSLTLKESRFLMLGVVLFIFALVIGVPIVFY
ncbi:hypothetical protein [Thalassotalea sp. ND16A]|uniref:hypothetical protein n=1 Tax=Thalassotalea sp. ND16A TaxID=1535422 RepID=UPI00051A15FD|nr:hypothetical protein [Thalassotalea sp. ND16A]KGJ97127.1 hypothetical protein ND16A_0049 [Thalassotalea sp. ND16A]